MRVAFIHDWLIGMRGGERCLEVLCGMFPQSEIFTLFYEPKNIVPGITALPVHESLLGRLKVTHRVHRFLLPFYPLAAKQLGRELERRAASFDAVISVSHCAAKNIPVPKSLPHLCYCLTPARYLWDQCDAYFANRPLEPLIKRMLPPLQDWDVRGAAGVSSFAGISEFIRKRIKRVYGRDSAVVYPPVRTDWISPCAGGEPGEGFLCVNALVPYKNVHIVIEAFNSLGLPLTVVGSGPEEGRLRAMAKGNIRFLKGLSDAELAALYRSSKALVFAAEEDFGMVPVEMQAAGRPVIALGKGGSLETVNVAPGQETGILFPEAKARCIVDAVQRFLDREHDFTVEKCSRQAGRFSLDRFRQDFGSWLQAEFGSGSNRSIACNRDVEEKRTAL